MSERPDWWPMTPRSDAKSVIAFNDDCRTMAKALIERLEIIMDGPYELDLMERPAWYELTAKAFEQLKKEVLGNE